jgi:SpoIID/LytB domain protein
LSPITGFNNGKWCFTVAVLAWLLFTGVYTHLLVKAQPVATQGYLVAKPPLATELVCQPTAHSIARAKAPGDWIRIGLSDDPMTNQQYPQAIVTATSPYRICTADASPVEFRSLANQPLKIWRNAQGFWLSQLPMPPTTNKVFGPLQGPLTIETTDPNGLLAMPAITRQGKVPVYRGFFEILSAKDTPNKLLVVNSLPMQDYLRAVVPNELPARYGLEAIRAQSVAARNYAVRPRETFWTQFDLCDSQYCQAYYGAQTETPETDRALQETNGLFALYRGEPILALYSSSNGGYSEDYGNAFADPKTKRFPFEGLPYLKGRPDVFFPIANLGQEYAARAFWTKTNVPGLEKDLPNYRWQFTWSRDQLEQSLNRTLIELSADNSTNAFVSPHLASKQAIGVLQGITVTQRGVSGKAMTVVIRTNKGLWTIQKEFVIRRAFAPPVIPGKPPRRMLPSANVVFDLYRNPSGKGLSHITVMGGGFGHGVGMSQLGASVLSGRGKSFTDILQYYYRGISVGSYPLQAGPQAVSAHFFVRQPKEARLRLLTTTSNSENGPQQAGLFINQQPITVPLPTIGLSTVDVSPYLQAGTTNTLTLPATTGRGFKAWIDVVSPQ